MSWKVWNSGLDSWHLQEDICLPKPPEILWSNFFLLGVDGSFRKVKMLVV
jgi:hypothetical protein